MSKYKRIFMIVTDSIGIGFDPRTKEFGDEGADTLFNVSKTKLLDIPTWDSLGISSITKIEGYPKKDKQLGYAARVLEISNAKDTLAGHWEMMGIKTEVPFPVFTDTGFPDDMLEVLTKAFDGKKIVGNKSASGTDIINELAHEERDNNGIIVYTSSDSVLQICGHEEWMTLDKLYEYGEKAREICNSKPEWNVGRIIVRPYIGQEGSYQRTNNRHDYAVAPTKKTILDGLKDAGKEVIGIGKIFDIFSGHGLTKNLGTNDGDEDGMNKTIAVAKEKTSKEQFIFVNLVDFDAVYGHRRNPEGYAKNINLFDKKLKELIDVLNDDDLLIITSDHGNDPTYKGTDHTREAVPMVVYSKSLKNPTALDEVVGMGTMGNIVAKNFGVSIVDTGEDIFEKIQ